MPPLLKWLEIGFEMGFLEFNKLYLKRNVPKKWIVNNTMIIDITNIKESTKGKINVHLMQRAFQECFFLAGLYYV